MSNHPVASVIVRATQASPDLIAMTAERRRKLGYELFEEDPILGALGTGRARRLRAPPAVEAGCHDADIPATQPRKPIRLVVAEARRRFVRRLTEPVSGRGPHKPLSSSTPTVTAPALVRLLTNAQIGR